MARQVRDGELVGNGAEDLYEVQSVRYRQVSAGKVTQISRSNSFFLDEQRS